MRDAVTDRSGIFDATCTTGTAKELGLFCELAWLDINPADETTASAHGISGHHH